MAKAAKYETARTHTPRSTGTAVWRIGPNGGRRLIAVYREFAAAEHISLVLNTMLEMET